MPPKEEKAAMQSRSVQTFYYSFKSCEVRMTRIHRLTGEEFKIPGQNSLVAR